MIARVDGPGGGLYVQSPFAPTVAADAATLRLALVPVAATLLVYLLSLPGDITGDHAGEWVTAAAVGGIPHAPGYPLWTLLAAGLNAMVPVGSAVWRVALLSALCTATATGLLTVWLSQQGLGRRAAVFGALLLGLGAAAWRQAVTPGPEPLGLLLALAAWVSLYQWIAGGRSVYLPVTVGLLVSGLLHHPVFVGVALPAVVVMVVRRPALRLGAGVWLGVALAVAVALLPAGYLPLRARERPFIDGGHPATLAAAIDHYRAALEIAGPGPVLDAGSPGSGSPDPALTIPGSPRGTDGSIGGRLAAASDALLWEHAGFGVLLGGIGLLLTLRRARGDGLLFAGLLLLPCTAAVLVRGVPAGAATAHPMALLLVVHAFVAVLAARAVDTVLQRFGNHPAWRARALTALAALLPSLLLAVHFGRGDHSDYTYARDYVRSTLQGLPENAVLFTGGRLETYPLLYHQGVLMERLDVGVVDRCGELDWQRIPLLALAPRCERTASDAILELLESGERPVFATWPLPVPFPAGFGWGQVGLLYRAARIGDPSLEPEHLEAWKAITFERLPASAATPAELGSIGAPLDGTARHLAAIYYGALARRLSAEGNPPAWNRASRLAHALRQD